MSTAAAGNDKRHDLPVSRAGLWFAVLGGPVAWTLHLLTAYLLAEFGCLTWMGRWMFLGASAVFWSVLVMTISTAAMGATAIYTGVAIYQQLKDFAATPHRDAQSATARIGIYTSVYAVLVILVESLPLIYYIRC